MQTIFFQELQQGTTLKVLTLDPYFPVSATFHEYQD